MASVSPENRPEPEINGPITTAPSLQEDSSVTDTYFLDESTYDRDLLTAGMILDAALETGAAPDRPSPSEDVELVALTEQVLHHLSTEDLTAYIEKVKRFDKEPTYVLETLPGQSTLDTSSGEPEFWSNLREDLKVLPQFFCGRENIGLSYQEGTALLFSLVDSIKYDFDKPADKIITLTNIMEECKERDVDLKGSIDRFKTFVTNAGHEGELGRALSVAQFGIAAGMSIDQSLEIIDDIYNGPGISGYVLMNLYDELNALRTNDLGGDLLFQSLKATMARGADFSDFTDLLYTAATRSTHSQSDIGHMIAQLPADAGATIAPSLLSTYPNQTHQQDQFDGTNTALVPTSSRSESRIRGRIKNPEEYFPALQGSKLAHGILPYRLNKSFIDGLQDLHALMKSELCEGAWVFDPASDTWHSLGGRTRPGHNGLQHRFFPYDLSALSPSPIFVHIHPEEGEILVRRHRDSLPHPELQSNRSGPPTNLCAK